MNFACELYYLGQLVFDFCDNMQILQRKNINALLNFLKIIYSKLEIITINLHYIPIIY